MDLRLKMSLSMTRRANINILVFSDWLRADNKQCGAGRCEHKNQPEIRCGHRTQRRGCNLSCIIRSSILRTTLWV